MKRIVVFDNGWGGEMVADYLDRGLGVAEVVRVIDWAHRTCPDGKWVCDAVASCLRQYIGEADVIVLGDYDVGTLVDELRERYPGQAFVAPTINYDQILRGKQCPETLAVFMYKNLREDRMFAELREKLPYSTFVLPECECWDELIDENQMTNDILRTELAWDFEIAPVRTNMKTRRRKEFSALELLAEESREKRALMQTIQKLDKAADAANIREQEAVAEVELVQKDYLAKSPERILPDQVLLLDTHLWEIKLEMERLFGWRVRILDFREKLLRDVCTALKLRGVDGKRSK